MSGVQNTFNCLRKNVNTRSLSIIYKRNVKKAFVTKDQRHLIAKEIARQRSNQERAKNRAKSREPEQLLRAGHAWWRMVIQRCKCAVSAAVRRPAHARPTFLSRSEFYSRPFAHRETRNASRETVCRVPLWHDKTEQRLLSYTHCQRLPLFRGGTQHATPHRLPAFRGIIASVEKIEIFEV